MAERDPKTSSVEDAKLNPADSTRRGVNISLVTWIMVLVFVVIVALGALMITGFLGTGMRNELPAAANSTGR